MSSEGVFFDTERVEGEPPTGGKSVLSFKFIPSRKFVINILGLGNQSGMAVFIYDHIEKW